MSATWTCRLCVSFSISPYWIFRQRSACFKATLILLLLGLGARVFSSTICSHFFTQFQIWELPTYFPPLLQSQVIFFQQIGQGGEWPEQAISGRSAPAVTSSLGFFVVSWCPVLGFKVRIPALLCNLQPAARASGKTPFPCHHPLSEILYLNPLSPKDKFWGISGIALITVGIYICLKILTHVAQREQKSPSSGPTSAPQLHQAVHLSSAFVMQGKLWQTSSS